MLQNAELSSKGVRGRGAISWPQWSDLQNFKGVHLVWGSARGLTVIWSQLVRLIIRANLGDYGSLMADFEKFKGIHLVSVTE